MNKKREKDQNILRKHNEHFFESEEKIFKYLEMTLGSVR